MTSKFGNENRDPLSTVQSAEGVTRRTVLQGSLAGAALMFTGSGAFAQAATPKSGGHLKIAMNGGASTDALDPASYISALQFVLARNWGDTLVETDPTTGKAVPALAESWETTDGGTTWSFKIRKNVRFHNGDALNVEDVVETLRRHSDKASKSGALGYLASIKSVEASGENVVVTLTEQNRDLPLIFSVYNLVIQPNGGRGDPNAGIGTGPFKIVRNNPGVQILLEKNKDDWHPNRGWVDSVEILAIADVSARTAALASGQVHFINAINPNTIPLLGRMKNITIHNTPGRSHYTMPMLVDQKPFDNVDLRLALKYAIDRKFLLKQVLGGYGTLGNDFPVNAAFDMFPGDIPQREFDPEKAAFHYKKSGFDGAVPIYAADVMQGGVDMAVILRDGAAKAGIKVAVNRVPTDGYWSGVWRNKPFCVSFFGTRLTQDLIYSLEFYSKSASNESKFDNAKFDTLLLAARAEADEAKRKEMYRDMALLVRDESGSIIPVFNNYLNASSPALKGFVPDVGNDLSNGYIASRVWLES
ncbi:ABC transporter substrate-binding protein [Rhizobium sp. VS19-DR104.2]|uniref:ABC transporter substrate-binding protein n=1 Tax=unclassified Rhizobium TaxID=2613769 RepID=UPI001CC45A89|nr:MULTISPECIES: ABC transporter substrate-binding protein [unclassified Rhizobium]MBZ5761308.1 ABC transporter substrate-binding protein [Rhizobium sp. VS19-DR96]MBZ5767062.1 ABC transporter substrate-binding protein [Rhizobium sp. VS19-DR129.2]MBZ5774947.1 ABC transporter substrate-binding protein [Rhizobium sp. VS19-DRK62.2]MBZ5785740.1 ABC transporter substrate-binding protein [Rhizobium sp. VS19-DR121]MBZ5803166.1 ABC transporter substrate-binding protein [Rhizobium sp. VS19-DR181]